MGYVSPGSVTSGGIATASWGNAVVADLAFFANPPWCAVNHSAAQSIPHNVDTVVAFNAERWDTDTMHDPVTNNSRITIKTAGLYELSFSGEFIAGADYQTHYAYFRLNGTTVIGVGTAGAVTTAGPGCLVNASTIYKFAFNDYVEVLVRQNNAAAAARNLNSVGNYTPEFRAKWGGLG